MTGMRSTVRSYTLLLWRQALESLIWLRYFENAPTVGTDRHLVVVDDDQHLGLALPDVVERLERQPAHQRSIAHHDHDALEAVPDVARLGEPFGDREARAGMAAVEHVVGRLRPAREAADPVELPQRAEALEAPRQELVRVRLVPGVPHDVVAGRLQQAVERDGELDDAQRRAQVAARDRDRGDDGLADLERELGELDLREAAQVGGALKVRQDRHGDGTPSVSDASARSVNLFPAGRLFLGVSSVQAIV